MTTERINPKWRRGLKSAVSSTAVKDGNILVTTDSGELFVDIDGNRIQITDAVVTTAELITAGTAPKNKFCLVEGDNGLEVYRYLSSTGTYQRLFTTDVDVQIATEDGVVIIADTVDSFLEYVNLKASELLAAMGSGYGTCVTAEATTEKAVVMSEYALITGGHISVKFSYAVPAGSTMNINSKGAKPIQVSGVAITENIIKAEDIVQFVYDGSAYQVLAVSSNVNAVLHE